MRKLDYKLRPARFPFILLLIFSAFAIAASEVKAQEIQELKTYVGANNFSSSDHFSDLLYGGNGMVEINDGQIFETKDLNPQTLSVYSNSQNLLDRAVQNFPSIEFIHFNVEGANAVVLRSDLSQAESLKYILFVIPDSLDPSRLKAMVADLNVNSKVIILYQISRPG